MSESDLKLIFLFITDLSDDLSKIKKEIIKCKDQFLKLFENVINKELSAEHFEKFNPTIFSIQKMLKPKISLVGFLGVGKTTITELIKNEVIPIKHEPSMTKDIVTIKIGSYYFQAWDFTSREQFNFLWSEFVKGSDAVLLVTDSTLENVEKSKSFLEIISNNAPHAPIAVIANKQDRFNAIEPEQIEKILGLKTYSIVAKDPNNKERILEIIMNILNINQEVARKLESLKERDKWINDLGYVIKEKRFESALSIVERIIDLSKELEDEEFRKKFTDMKQKIDKILKKEVAPDEEIISTVVQQLESQKISLKKKNIKTLLRNYNDDVKGIIAITVCDRDGFIITSESKKESESEIIIGAMATMVDSYMDRIKSEFGEGRTCFNSSMISDKKFTYCSMGPISILTTLAEQLTSDIELRVYSEHIASKIELILEGNENVSTEIPQVIKAISKTKGGILPSGNFSVKIIMTGNYQVGKTSLIKRFVWSSFAESYQSTIGVDISRKIIDINDDTKITFVLWDIGGQITQMAPYRTRFYEGADSALIVLDRTRPETLKSVDMWYNDMKQHIPDDIIFILVGNKSDLVDNIVLSEEDIKSVAEKYGFHYILTSAKTGENVNDSFLYIAYRFLESL